MLLIGIKMSFTKKPTNPITTNPIAVRTATFVNSTKNQNNAKKSNHLHQYTEIYLPNRNHTDPPNSKEETEIHINYLCGLAYGNV